MFDIHLRSVKDRAVQPLVQWVPQSITPTHVTAAGFLLGIGACVAAGFSETNVALFLWLSNRLLDCLDGILARDRNQATDLGAFHDLLCDFIIYSSLPIAVALGQEATTGYESHSYLWPSVAFVEATFHINNFVLFYCAAIAAKPEKNEVTSVTMRPALIEGFESGLLFTAMLIWPSHVGTLCWVMGGLVAFGVLQRSWYLSNALSPAKSRSRASTSSAGQKKT